MDTISDNTSGGKRPDGGSVYPMLHLTQFDPANPGRLESTYSNAGLTLRDYFAGQVMAGIMGLAIPFDHEWNPAKDASAAYAVADAMLAERAR